MSDYTLTIKSDEKKGVLDDITDVITSHGANISYVHLFVEKNNMGSINLELEHVEDIDDLISDLKSIEEIKIYQNADCFLLGNESFCVRYNHSYSNEEIIEAQKLIKSLNKKTKHALV